MINNLDIVEFTTQYEALKNKGDLLSGSTSTSGSIGAGAQLNFETAITLPADTTFIQTRAIASDQPTKLMALETMDGYTVNADVFMTYYLRVLGSTAYLGIFVVNTNGSVGYALPTITLTGYLRAFISPF